MKDLGPRAGHHAGGWAHGARAAKAPAGVDASSQGGCRAAELSRALLQGGLCAQDTALTGPAERRRPAPLGGTESKSGGARQKVARPFPSSRPPAVEPHARLHIWVQSSSRHSSGGVLLAGSLHSHPRRCVGTAPTKPPLTPFLDGAQKVAVAVSCNSVIKLQMRAPLNCRFNSCTMRSVQGETITLIY